MFDLLKKLRRFVGKSFLNLNLKNAIADGARFERLIFPWEDLNDIHAIQFFKFDNDLQRIASGLGVAFREELAYFISAIEYFERRSFLVNKDKYDLKSTNGIAAGLIYADAKLGATNELFERDAFLRHWYTATPFAKISSIPESIQKYMEIFQGHKVELKFYKTILGYQQTICCFIVNSKTQGFAIGLSSGKGQDRDVEKAFFEAIINYFFGNEGLSEEELLERNSRGIFSKLLDHRTYWLYKNKIPEWIEESPVKDISTFSKKNYECNEIYSEKGAVVTVCLVSSNLIPIKLGPLTNEECAKYENLIGFGLTVMPQCAIHPIP